MHEPVAGGVLAVRNERFRSRNGKDRDPRSRPASTASPGPASTGWSFIGLGTVWILDGLEVTIVGSIGQRPHRKGQRAWSLDASQIGTAAAFYVGGACIGALFFGQLTDRFGRKKLFLVTLGVYIVADDRHRLLLHPLVLLRRPLLHRRGDRRRVRGDQLGDRRADPGPGAGPGRPDDQRQLLGRRRGGAVASIALLDTALFAADVGWRLAFGIGATARRRHPPGPPQRPREPPLAVHPRPRRRGRTRSSARSRNRSREENGEELTEPEKLDRGQAPRARSASARSPRPRSPNTRGGRSSASPSSSARPSSTTRSLSTSAPCSANSSTSPSSRVAVLYRALRASPTSSDRSRSAASSTRSAANRWSPAPTSPPALSPPFSATSCVPADSLTTWTFMALVLAIFFLASAGASSAYLTVSEIFPMETRALSIAFFYAVGTGGRRHRRPPALRPPHQHRHARPGRDRLLHRGRRDGDRWPRRDASSGSRQSSGSSRTSPSRSRPRRATGTRRKRTAEGNLPVAATGWVAAATARRPECPTGRGGSPC